MMFVYDVGLSTVLSLASVCDHCMFATAVQSVGVDLIKHGETLLFAFAFLHLPVRFCVFLVRGNLSSRTCGSHGVLL